MSKGENIIKRKDGRWEARYIKGYELSGKIKYGFCYGKTYKEAKEIVTKCKAALVSGQPLPKSNSKHRFTFYCDEWFKRQKKIKELVDDKAQFADWSTRDDIKNQLNMELTVLLYPNGYPPEWDEEVFEAVQGSVTVPMAPHNGRILRKI